MAASIGDILQVVVEGQSAGEPTVNVYFYEVEATSVVSAGYEPWMNNFLDTVIDPLRAVMNTSTFFNQYTLKNLTNGVDFFTLTETRTGTLAGAVVAAYMTFTAQLVRSTLVTRNGSKRYSGLVEEGITGNTINWVPAQKAAIEAALQADIGTIGFEGIEAKAVIVGRIPTGMPGAGGLDLTRINDVADARLGNRTSSQNTRKLPQVY